jgi:hypothetical protein
MMCLWDWASYKKKKYEKEYIFFASLKSMKKELDPFIRGTDLGIRIRTKMSRIPNTGLNLQGKGAGIHAEDVY